MPASSWKFRHATLADVPVVVALVESAYRGDGSRAGWTTEADLLDGHRTDAADVADCIARARSIVLLAERDGVVVACAHVAVDVGGGEHAGVAGGIEHEAGYFGMFSVTPTLQRAGIGKRLLAEAERVAREHWQLSVMRMNVFDVRPELIAYYERRGYVRTGITKPFLSSDPRFGVPKRADLRFEVLEKRLVPVSEGEASSVR
jgi:GNAT superfamily N-acetyltransferase